jgi:hypothetical protein
VISTFPRNPQRDYCYDFQPGSSHPEWINSGEQVGGFLSSEKTIKCPICSRENPAGELLCDCGASLSPSSVQNLPTRIPQTGERLGCLDRIVRVCLFLTGVNYFFGVLLGLLASPRLSGAWTTWFVLVGSAGFASAWLFRRPGHLRYAFATVLFLLPVLPWFGKSGFPVTIESAPFLPALLALGAWINWAYMSRQRA